ncbi:DNA-binding protein [Chryseobacterium joostei]|uniref:DNA binding domain-containing protein, excisionase family n=1 Tax=Chryseobacterium joostei TaxID=112234 RepID=A0A1N7IHU3_9FLAO|nr:helix-turn-helix domain-containing protein [Chryseobacterium joostei]AZB00314.1 DNA-binding protein [Chryseobacterium joostei]SIS36521.1 DNA binding domain-containing protein, excisionase family [Chryseobacterium joostei]
MKNGFLQMIQTTPNELSDLLQEGIKTQLENFKKSFDLQNQEVLLTYEETCEFLKINHTTLWRWVKGGKIPCYSIHNKRYFKRSEIMECLTKLKQ